MPTKTTPKKAPASRGKPATAKARPGAASIRHRPASASPPAPGGILPASSGVPRGRRTSVNLYDQDLDLLEPLRVHLRAATGLRVIRDSSLVQVLCRTYQPGPAAVAALRLVLALDGRH